MKEVHYYEACDGTRFESYEECHNYEAPIVYKTIYDGGVVVFNSKFEGKTATKKTTVYDLLDYFESGGAYIMFKSSASRDSFLDLLDRHGFYCMTDGEDKNSFILGDIYKYDAYEDTWFNFSKQVKKDAENEKKMREWGN